MSERARLPVLGVDAGASGTRIRCEGRPGTVVVERAGPTLDFGGVGSETLDATLGALLDGCPPPGIVVAGVAGRSHLRAAVGGWLEQWSGAPVTAVPDYVVALRSFEPRVGVAVIAGTGSVVVGRDPAGRVVKTGGLGHLVGDEGSAFRLGRALVASCLDGVPDATRFAGAVERALGVERSDIVRVLYDSRRPAAMLARVAPVLTAAADADDEWARDVVAREMVPLAESTVHHVERFGAPAGADPLVVGLAGGVWRSSSARAEYARAVDARFPDPVTVVTADQPPVVGAVRLAWDAV